MSHILRSFAYCIAAVLCLCAAAPVQRAYCGILDAESGVELRASAQADGVRCLRPDCDDDCVDPAPGAQPVVRSGVSPAAVIESGVSAQDGTPARWRSIVRRCADIRTTHVAPRRATPY